MEVKNTIEKINIPNVGKLVLSDKVKEYIDVLHKKVGAIEWSGMMFYKIASGDIKQMKDMVFNVDFIYPRDIGSHTYTETHADGDIANAYDIFEDGIEYSTGLIHTHHSMSTFFSGTDTAELEKNAMLYNYYISLIVNFDGKYCAKIAFPGKQVAQSKTTLKDSDGKPYVVTNNIERDIIFIGDLDVEYKKDEIIGDKWLLDKIKELQEKKKQASHKPVFAKGFDNNFARGLSEKYPDLFSSQDPAYRFKESLRIKESKIGTVKEFLGELIVFSFDPLADEEKGDCIERDLKSLCEDEDQSEIALSVISEDIDDIYTTVFGATSDKEMIINLNGAIDFLKDYESELKGKFFYDNLILFLDETVSDIEYEIQVSNTKSMYRK